jgi:hypothetical protein
MTLVAAMLPAVSCSVARDSDRVSDRHDRRPGNAATVYWQAIECLIDRHQADTAYADYLQTISEGHAVPLDHRATAAIERAAMALYLLRRGSRLEECDWGIAFDDLGADAEQGHPGQVRKLAGAGCLSARISFERQQPQEAIDDLVAVLRLLAHLGNEGRDGARALLTQVSVERRVIDIAANRLAHMDAAGAERIAAELKPFPISDILRNFFAAQKRDWVDWSVRFAEHARRHEGDWNAWWRHIGLRDSTAGGTGIGELLRNAADGQPARLLSLAREAATVCEEGMKLVDLPEGEFRPAWRALWLKSADENPILENAGGEVEPILDMILLADARRALLRAGVVVSGKGEQALKNFQSASGPFEYHRIEGGFGLSSSRRFEGRRVKLVFTHPAPLPRRSQ